MRKPRTIKLLALLLAAGTLAAGALLPAGASAAKTKTFRPIHAKPRALVFAPRKVDPDAIRNAKLRLRNRRTHRNKVRHISVKRVRRVVENRRRLRLRKAQRARGKLKVKVAPSRPGSAPTPTPAPSPTPGSCQWGTFSGTAPPNGCWRPYSDSSPFNVGVGPFPREAANSDAIVARTLGFGEAGPRGGTLFRGGIADTSSDYDHPLYYSQPGDPAYTVRCRQWIEVCEVDGITVRIPAEAQPAGGSDAHLGVIDQSSGWEYDLWETEPRPADGGILHVGHGGMTRIGAGEGDGLGSNATAAHFGLAAGVIRPEELAAGEINHALFMVVKCSNGTYVWPAHGPGVGRPCSRIGLSNEHAPALGQHFYLDMTDAEIDALSVPFWKKTVLRAMARYGMFVGDTGSDYLGWSIVVQSGSSYTSFGMPDPWVQLAQNYGIPPSSGKYYFDLKDTIDWRAELRVADACVSRRAC